MGFPVNKSQYFEAITKRARRSLPPAAATIKTATGARQTWRRKPSERQGTHLGASRVGIADEAFFRMSFGHNLRQP